MEVLILSSPQDVHYRAVHWALTRIGVESGLHFGNCFPADEPQTLRISEAELSYRGCVEGGRQVDLLEPSVVWYRRGHWPMISTAMCGADRDAATREAEMFVDGVRSLAARKQRWINDPDKEAVANRKPYQLHVAKQSGLNIPRTMMSNDPTEIGGFFAECGGEVILKAFRAMQWINEKEHLILFARKLRFEEIDDPSALRLTSHIFQEYVEKRYELRVFCFGDRLVTVKLNSQANAATEVDWRISTDGLLAPELCRLPEKVAAGVRRYMDCLGLEYGAFDFIVRPDGEHVFLECNVSGQFLFVEEWNPEIRILGEFINFLTRDLDLSPQQRSAIGDLRYLDFYHSAETAAHYDAIAAGYPRGHVSRNLHREEPVA